MSFMAQKEPFAIISIIFVIYSIDVSFPHEYTRDSCFSERHGVRSV